MVSLLAPLQIACRWVCVHMLLPVHHASPQLRAPCLLPCAPCQCASVLPLHLFQPDDKAQLHLLTQLIGKVPAVIHSFLQKMVFPSVVVSQVRCVALVNPVCFQRMHACRCHTQQTVTGVHVRCMCAHYHRK